MRGHSNNFISPISAQRTFQAVSGHSRTGGNHVDAIAMPLPSMHPFLSTNQFIWRVLSDVSATLITTVATRLAGTAQLMRNWKAAPSTPVKKKESLCVAYRAHAVEGCKELESANLLEETGELRASDRNVDSHNWQEENVLISEPQATTHREKPWPHGKTCSPSSISADQRPEEGFEEMRAKP